MYYEMSVNVEIVLLVKVTSCHIMSWKWPLLASFDNLHSSCKTCQTSEVQRLHFAAP